MVRVKDRNWERGVPHSSQATRYRVYKILTFWGLKKQVKMVPALERSFSYLVEIVTSLFTTSAVIISDALKQVKS